MIKPEYRVVKANYPESANQVASRRVLPLLLNFKLMDFNLQVLLRSCYLQGVEDAVMTLMKRPEVLRERVEEGEYQI